MKNLFQLLITPLKFLTGYRLFQRNEQDMTSLQIILWWEARRLFFNIIVGLAGVMTIVVMLFSAAIAEKLFNEPIGWPDPPFFAIIGVILYAIGANGCYTGGWIAELISHEVWGEKARGFSEISFTLGVVFSFLLTLVPGALVVFAVVCRFIYKTLIQ
jgi:hypothetical protein